MSKETFPPIGEEILSTPRPKLDVSLKPRQVPEEAITEGAKAIGEKWGSVTQLPPRQAAPAPEPAPEPAAPDRSKWPSVRFECPPYLDRELTIAAAQRGHTKTYLILKLLAENGFTVHPEDLVEDKRKQRK
ncbi:MAG: hypothetical protein INR62_13530 [Rhodospirillales bacterium]|nr:hypothetical protein [Acetobacter sp.]